MSEAIEAKIVEEIFDDDTRIVTDDGVYTPRYYDPNDVEFDKKFAYIVEKDNPDALFYPYRGKLTSTSVLPGLYKGKLSVPVFIEPSDDQKPNFILSSHTKDLNLNNIIKVLHDNENFYCTYPESSKLFIPDIEEFDDVLKRAIKLALKAKNIDLDSCKDRFTDKNALFNFKQVIRNPKAKLSILLFERGCEALGLKYRIILEEANPHEVIGTSLDSPEARNNIIRNVTGSPIISDGDNVGIPDKVKDNFRTDDLNLTGKIIISSDDTFGYSN
jgi:hypothetical protein